VPKAPATGLAEAPKPAAEAKEKAAEEPELGEMSELPKILSPPLEPELSMVSKAHAITPKRRRMASVLDAILESTRASTPAPVKETAEAATVRAEPEAGPSVPFETEPAGTGQSDEQGLSDVGLVLEKEDTPKEIESPTLEALSEGLGFIIQHASGKRLSEEEITEARHYARELKYPKGALVYNGTDENDFLYCLPDNKEISVYREMAKNMGFLKLEVALSVMSKDDLADNLAYNSLKVHKLWTCKQILFCVFYSCADLLFPLFLQGLILSNALIAQKNTEDESYQIALGNLRSEVIKLGNEATEKDKIFLSLVDKVKASEANLAVQSETHRAEIENLKKKLAEKNEDFEVAKAKQEISEWTSARLQKNVDELRESKERYYEKSLDCAKELKTVLQRWVPTHLSKKLLEAISKESSKGSVKKPKLLKRSLVIVVISAPLPVPEGLQQFWKNLAANTLKLQPRRRLPLLWET
jgi:hypothetical protein